MDFPIEPQVALGQRLAPIVSRLWMLAPTATGAASVEAAAPVRARPTGGSVTRAAAWMAVGDDAIMMPAEGPRRGAMLLH
jgi:hypothetical protein